MRSMGDMNSRGLWLVLSECCSLLDEYDHGYTVAAYSRPSHIKALTLAKSHQLWMARVNLVTFSRFSSASKMALQMNKYA